MIDVKGKDSLIDLGDDSSDVNDKLPNKFSGLCKSIFSRIYSIFHIFIEILLFLAVGGMASSQLSQINSVTAQSGSKDVDEFDILAQSRNDAKSS